MKENGYIFLAYISESGYITFDIDTKNGLNKIG